MLPWVTEHRRAARDRGEHQTAERYLVCGPCREKSPELMRKLWHCGFLPRLPDHRGEYPMPDGPVDRPACDTCPGYLVQLPPVEEAARAYGWWDKGQLRDFCDDEVPTENLRDCLDLLRVVVSEVEAERFRKGRET